MKGCCCHPQAEILQAQQSSTKGFSGDRAVGEHGATATATAASIPLSAEVLQLILHCYKTKQNQLLAKRDSYFQWIQRTRPAHRPLN